MIFETLRIAIRSLNSNKLRSILSMLGIIIGVGAVIAVISIASGTQEQVTGRISDMGSNQINIRPGISRGRFGSLSSTATDVFTVELGEAIVEYCPAVSGVIPSSQTSGYLMVGDDNYQATLIGTSKEYQIVNKYYPDNGKFFSKFDIDNGNNVIVLGSDLVDELYDKQNPVGKKITFYSNNHSYVFNIIGVMEEKERGISGDLNGNAYIPITTYLNMFSNSRYVSSFVAQAASSEEASTAVDQIEYLLTKYLDNDGDFNIMSQDQLLDTITEVTGSMKLMLSGIAAISLLVGGIGIMNIMLVSVTERTKEIGIRKALGAKRKNIMGQFIIEALTLSSVGGVVGVIVGGTGAYFVSQLGGWPLVISPATVLLAFGFSLIVGIFFGIYPAVKASKLDPVDALSYE